MVTVRVGVHGEVSRPRRVERGEDIELCARRGDGELDLVPPEAALEGLLEGEGRVGAGAGHEGVEEMSRGDDQHATGHELLKPSSLSEEERRDEHHDQDEKVGVIEEREPFHDGSNVPGLHPDRRRSAEKPEVDGVQATVHQVGLKRRKQSPHLEVREHHRNEQTEAIGEGTGPLATNHLATAKHHRARRDHEKRQS